MKTKSVICILGTVFLLSGCVVRTYSLTRDRVDQDLSSGNRGYLSGTAPQEDKIRPATRTTHVVEVELRSPLKFEKSAKKAAVAPVTTQAPQDEGAWGNQGYVSETQTPAIAQMPGISLEEYTVQKNDTLQKISQKFFGTTKKWKKIYEANLDRLKAPDKIYPGQKIVIPVEAGAKGTLK